MKVKEISKKAKEQGVCQEWYKKMQASNLESLCRMYFEGLDWSEENDFPSAEMLRNTKMASLYGLHTDAIGQVKAYELPDGRQQMAFFGASIASVEFNNYAVAQVVVRHASEVKIIARDNAFVSVDVLDDAEVEIQEIDNAKIVVHNKKR